MKFNFSFRKKEKTNYTLISIEDFPEAIEGGKLYLIGSQNKKWLIAMLCPCGCDAVIQLNLLKEAKPQWKTRINKKGHITVLPSIRRIIGCQSHFHIIKSSVQWH
ncbi:MAG: hypothetical protein JST48_10635 [Bacteroidetes bacterium]|nr:hypothetical protein [Bacteroidota bacterium]